MEIFYGLASWRKDYTLLIIARVLGVKMVQMV